MTHSSSLSPQQVRVLSAVTKHTQLTSSQIKRLLYRGTAQGTRIRSQRHLKRLSDLGLLRRVWTVYGNRPAEHLYMPVGTTTRGSVAHTLDISELYVQLTEKLDTEFVYDREPWCHVPVGRITLKPDAFLDLGEDRKCFVEVDRGTEGRAQLSKQMRAYVRAFEHEWDTETDGDHFPQVIWTVPDNDRRRLLLGVVRMQSSPEIFRVVLFDEAADRILRG